MIILKGNITTKCVECKQGNTRTSSLSPCIHYIIQILIHPQNGEKLCY